MLLLKSAAIAFAVASALATSGCSEEQSAGEVRPVALTVDDTGYYCQMTVVDHGGPKAQIHLKSGGEVLWFTQVRDAIAFTRRPEEPRDIAAVFVSDMGLVSDTGFVSDMGRAASWEQPGADNWIRAETAFFVLGSAKAGGMGAPEAVPFATEAGAKALVAEYGGRIARFEAIPDEYVFAPVDVGAANAMRAGSHGDMTPTPGGNQ
jgi:copper chaperone NosL